MAIQPDLLARIEDSLSSIRPYLEADGGDIEIVDLTEDNILQVKLTGACQTCPMSPTTMKAGVEEAIRAAIPEINAVQAINV